MNKFNLARALIVLALFCVALGLSALANAAEPAPRKIALNCDGYIVKLHNSGIVRGTISFEAGRWTELYINGAKGAARRCAVAESEHTAISSFGFNIHFRREKTCAPNLRKPVGLQHWVCSTQPCLQEVGRWQINFPQNFTCKIYDSCCNLRADRHSGRCCKIA